MASVSELIELIGRDETIRLIDAYGGGRLYVPRARRPDLEPLVSARAHTRIVARYGGDRLDIPPRSALDRLDERAERIALVRRMHAEGLSYHEIERRTGITRRQVRRLLRAEQP